jgi:hypothetical protein
MEDSNRPRRTDYLKFETTGHVNPFMDIEIISLYLSSHLPAIKGLLPFMQEGHKNISPFHLVNFLSSQLTPIITLFIFNTKKC